MLVKIPDKSIANICRSCHEPYFPIAVPDASDHQRQRCLPVYDDLLF